MNQLFLFFSLRHARTHKVRTALTLSGVALGVAVVIAINTVNHSILESFRRMIDSIAGRATLQVTAGDAGVPEDLWERIEKSPCVRYVTPVIQQLVRVPQFGDETVLILGIDFTGDEEFRDYRFSKGGSQVEDPLAFLNDPEAVLVSDQLADQFDKNTGDRIGIRTAEGTRTLRVMGHLKAEGPARAFGGNFMVMDVFAAQALFGREGRFDRYDVITAESFTVQQAMTRLKRDLDGAYEVKTPAERGDNARTLLASFQAGLTMGAFVALLVGLFLIYNTMQISVAQRRKEISIARALGARRRDVIRLFVGEALILGCIASALGVGIGLWLASFLLKTVSGAVSLNFLRVRPDQIYSSAGILMFGFLCGVGASVIASLGPARTAASITPVEGLKFDVGGKPFRPTWTTINAKIALVLSIFTVLLWWIATRLPGVYWGYGTQLGVTLVFAFLAPTLLVTAFRFFARIPRRFFPPSERLAFEQLPRQAARAAVTLSAIMLGFAMVVEIDNYIYSLKRTIERWVIQTIPADLFVTSGAKLARSENRPMRADLADTIAAWPEVRAVDQVRMVQVDFNGVPITLLSNRPEIYLTHVPREFIDGSRNEALRLLNDRPTVLVAENFKRRFRKGIGDVLDLPTPKGILPVLIVGVVEDYTSDRGIVIMSRAQFTKSFDDPLVDSLDVFLRDPGDAHRVRKRVLSLEGIAPDLFVLTNKEMREEVFRIIDETYKVVKVLEIIAVLVSILGIVNTILASVLERARMIGVLRALGATRRQITRMVIAEGGYLTFGGLVLGLVLGVILTEVIFSTVLPASTGWTFRMFIPYARLIGVSAVGLALATLAAYLPARHAARLNIVKAIEYE
ncbi:MAG: FtsX-like permease family protein [Pseudomonadota bacterium]